MTIVRHARVLASTLVLGAVILGISAGQAEARDNRTGDKSVKCVYYNDDGEMEFFDPGAIITVDDAQNRTHILECESDGNWFDLGTAGGGIGTPARPLTP